MASANLAWFGYGVSSVQGPSLLYQVYDSDIQYYAFIPTRDHLEVVHLISGKTSIWTFDEFPIKGNITSIKIGANQQPGVLNKAYSMIIGTTGHIAKGKIRVVKGWSMH